MRYYQDMRLAYLTLSILLSVQTSVFGKGPEVPRTLAMGVLLSQQTSSERARKLALFCLLVDVSSKKIGRTLRILEHPPGGILGPNLGKLSYVFGVWVVMWTQVFPMYVLTQVNGDGETRLVDFFGD